MLGHGNAEPHQKIAGGAPRGARPRSQGGAGRLASARHVLATRARGPRKPPRLSALRRPSSGGGKEKQNPGVAARRGNEETALFDTVNRNEAATRVRCAPRGRGLRG